MKRAVVVLSLAVCALCCSACTVNGEWEGELSVGSDYFDLSWDVLDKQISKLRAVGFQGDWDVTYRFSPKITVGRRGEFDYSYKMQGVEVLYFDGTLDKRRKTGDGMARLYYDYGDGVLYFKNRVEWEASRIGRKALVVKQGGDAGMAVQSLPVMSKAWSPDLIQLSESSVERIVLSADVPEQDVRVALSEGGILKALLAVTTPSSVGVSAESPDFLLERILPTGETLDDARILGAGEEAVVRVVRVNGTPAGFQSNVTLLLSAE